MKEKKKRSLLRSFPQLSYKFAYKLTVITKLMTTVTAENSWSVRGFRFCWVQTAANDLYSLFPSLLFWSRVRCPAPRRAH